MLTKELEKLGLNNREANVYLALLQLGRATLQEISEKSAVKRTTVYGIIKSLKEKGLLKITVGKKKILYCAQDPQKIEEDLKEKQQVLSQIMPQLLALTPTSEKKARVSFFASAEEIKEIYKDIQNRADGELLLWATKETSENSEKKSLGSFYIKEKIKDKKDKNLIKVITTKSLSSTTEKIKKDKGESFMEIKITPKDQPPIKAEINLYGKNKIAMISPGESAGFIIESQEISDTLKSIFESHWKNL